MRGIVLALDTSTESVGLGVARFGEDGMEVLVREAILAPRQANSLLLACVVERLGECGLGIRDVGAVVVGRGPGSFTGVRIGVSAAKGLAQGLGVELYGVSTTEAIAWETAVAVPDGLIGVVGDAMRGEVYPVLVEVSQGEIVSATPDRVTPPAEVAAEWAETTAGRIVLSGNGLKKYSAIFGDALGTRAVFAPEHAWYPTGYGLLRAWSRAIGGGVAGTGAPSGVLPVYTRLSDAEENERVRMGDASVPLPDSGVVGGSPDVSDESGPTR